MSELVTQVKALQGMNVAQLRERYREVFGEDALSRNARALRERIEHRLVELDTQRQREERADGNGSGEGDLIHRLHVLRHMGLDDLRAEHARIFGVPSKSRNRKALFVKIAKKIQADSLPAKPAQASKQGDLIPQPTLTVKFEPKRKPRAKGTAKAGKKATPKSEPKRAAKPIGARDPRLPKPGTTITREWYGKKYLVRVLEQGFEFERKPYRSLSALAKHITGQIVNGYAWFHVGVKESKKS